MNVGNLKDLFGSIASLFQIIQFFSGALVCKKFMRKGTSDDISPFPFICGFVSCTVWTGYSKLLDDFILIYINVLGSLLMFAYCCAYYVYTSKKGKILKVVLCIIIAIVTIQLHIATIPNIEDKKQTLGIICSFLTIGFFAAPFSNLAQVIRLRSSESLPFPMILTSFIVSLLWTVYGYLLDDNYVLYLNMAGFILCFIQLTLFWVYPTRWMSAPKQEVTILLPEHRIKIFSS